MQQATESAADTDPSHIVPPHQRNGISYPSVDPLNLPPVLVADREARRNGITTFWNEDATRYTHARWRGTPEARFDAAETRSFVNRCLGDEPGMVLDVGCGPGYWLNGPTSLGCDLSIPRLRKASTANGCCRVARADWVELPFTDAAFDATLLIHVAEYEHDHLDLLLAEVRRVLKPGGCVCIVTKNRDGLPWRAARRLANREAPCPHPAVGRSVAELAAVWGAAPVQVRYLSSRLVLSLRDVNDAARGEAPAPVRWLALGLARMLAPVLRSAPIARHLAWHVGVCFERPRTDSHP
jgi:SAM-dependent methyltransferase